MVTNDDILSILSNKIRITPINISNLVHDQPLRLQGIDSLDISVFIFALEEKYSISIPTSKIGELLSIQDFQSYVNQQLAKVS